MNLQLKSGEPYHREKKSRVQSEFEVLLENNGMGYEHDLDSNTIYFWIRGTNYRELGYSVNCRSREGLFETSLVLLKEHLNHT